MAATLLAGEQGDGTGQRRQRAGRGGRTHRQGDLTRRPTVAAAQQRRVDPEGLLGAEPRRQAPGRRRDWQAAQAALERLAGWGRHRDQPHPDRADRERRGRLNRTVGYQERDGR